MARTYKKVRYSPERKDRGHTPASAAEGVEEVLRILEGRWKLVILFHLFDGNLLRFSELERAIPSISQKMLIQQLRQLEKDGVVRRIVHHQVPPKVEYGLTDWGQSLCPALDEMLKWAASRDEFGWRRLTRKTELPLGFRVTLADLGLTRMPGVPPSQT